MARFLTACARDLERVSAIESLALAPKCPVAARVRLQAFVAVKQPAESGPGPKT